MALVFVPALAAVLFMFGGAGVSLSGIVAMAMFGALATGVFIGLMRMVRDWEGDEQHHA